MRTAVNLFNIAISRDITNTLRLWRLNPWTSIAAYLALTVGIGATTSIFSVLSSLLLSPLPIADSDQVVAITSASGRPYSLSLPDVLDMKSRLQLVKQFAFYRGGTGNVAEGGRPVPVQTLEIDAALFDVLGVRMARGHPFGPVANQQGQPCEGVMSWPFWQSQFGGLPVSGKTLLLNEHPCFIDGVLPRGLDLPIAADLWIPAHFNTLPEPGLRRLHAWSAIAHLKPGSTIASFSAELARLCGQLASEHPEEDAGLKVTAIGLRDYLSLGVRRSLWILFAAVAGVLLMACFNVANLLLARLSTRLRELSVRVAVGANRWMVFQQLITESLMLALVSSLSGLALTFVAVRFLRDLPGVPVPRPESVSVDWRVLLFALGAAGLSGLAFGIFPAFRASFTSLTGVLSQASGRVSESRRQQMLRRLLVGAETTIATVLLIASLLLIRSFNQVLKVNPGFEADHLLIAYVSLPPSRYGSDTMDTVRFADQALTSLRNSPGIVDAAVATSIPLQNNDGQGPVQIEGGPTTDLRFIIGSGISPSYRKTLGIALLAGRDLDNGDNRDGATAVLVNEAFARRFFPGTSAIGKRLRFSPATNPNAPWLQIVGVLGDTKQFGLESPVQPQLFMPLALNTNPFPAIIARTAGNPYQHVRDLETAVRHADPGIAVIAPRTMERVEARRLGARTFITGLLSGFALVALLLASGGIFAVVAYSVSQRTAEIGLRMACGATQADILRMIVRQGLLPSLGGIGLGVLGAALASRFLASFLFGVQAADAISYAGTVLLLGTCCVAAALLPALRAARVQPWQALRYE